MEAINLAGTVIGVLAEDGVVLAAEKKVTSTLLDRGEAANEKIFLLNSNVVAGVAGMTADANSLVNYARTQAQSHLYTFNEDIPVEQLTQKLCDLKQGYTQFGGLRPFGVSLLYAGHDPHYGFQLYVSDPSGNYSGWKASCIGVNNGTATSLLKQDYEDGIKLWEPGPEREETEGIPKDKNKVRVGAVELACRVLSKTLDSTVLDAEKLEFAILSLDDNKPKAHILSPVEIDLLIKKYALGKKETAAAQPTPAPIAVN